MVGISAERKKANVYLEGVTPFSQPRICVIFTSANARIHLGGLPRVNADYHRGYVYGS